jgi:hypothetical protein
MNRETVIACFLLACICAITIFDTSAVGQTYFSNTKPLKFGVGCAKAMAPLQAGFGLCITNTKKVRLWCPNSTMFERDEPVPEMSLVRSVCGLNQKL